MALRNLAKKLRIPTSAAARLPSAPNPADFRFPSDPSAWRASVSRLESARDWYEFQRARYDDVTTELKNFRREVVWTERAANLFDLVYKVGCPIVVGTLVIKVIVYRAM
ncbi:hypothetical protein ACQJBY_056484 [Aegilops geniculata]